MLDLAVQVTRPGMPPSAFLAQTPSSGEPKPELARALSLARAAARDIGSKILPSIDEDDLAGRIDVVVQSGLLFRYERDIADGLRAVLRGGPEALRGLGEKRESVYAVLDPEAARDATEAERLATEAFQFAVKLERLLGVLSVALRADERPTPGPDEFFAVLAREPLPLARLYLARARGAAAMFALMAVTEAGREIESWLAGSLARRHREGAWAALRLLASIPVLEVPEDLVPQAERLDPARLRLEQGEEDAWIAARAQEAAASGVPVHPAPDADD